MKATNEDGIVIDKCILASGSISPCVEILQKLKGDSSVIGQIASDIGGKFFLNGERYL